MKNIVMNESQIKVATLGLGENYSGIKINLICRSQVRHVGAWLICICEEKKHSGFGKYRWACSECRNLLFNLY